MNVLRCDEVVEPFSQDFVLKVRQEATTSQEKVYMITNENQVLKLLDLTGVEYFNDVPKLLAKTFFRFSSLISCPYKLYNLENSRWDNWWGSAKRDVTHPTATVVYNAWYNF